MFPLTQTGRSPCPTDGNRGMTDPCICPIDTTRSGFMLVGLVKFDQSKRAATLDDQASRAVRLGARQPHRRIAEVKGLLARVRWLPLP